MKKEEVNERHGGEEEGEGRTTRIHIAASWQSQAEQQQKGRQRKRGFGRRRGLILTLRTGRMYVFEGGECRSVIRTLREKCEIIYPI